MTLPESTPSNARPGTTMDLARRMDRMESAHEALAREVGGLTTTIARVELNQHHAEEVNKLRFDAMTDNTLQIRNKLDLFIDKIDKIISGESSTPQSRAGEQMVEDYLKWREGVDKDLEDTQTLKVQLRFLSRLVVILTGGSVITTLLAVWSVLSGGGIQFGNN